MGTAAALGAALGLRPGIVRCKASLLIAFAGMAFAPLALWLAHQIDSRWLGALFTAVLLSGVVFRAVAGTLHWAVAVPFTAGALADMFGGRLIADRLAGRHLQMGFALVAAAVAVGMLVDSFFF